MSLLSTYILFAIMVVVSYYALKWLRLWLAFRTIPRVSERFPGSFTLDLLWDMSCKKLSGTSGNSATQIYARWLYEEMESKVPGYYEHPVVGGILGPIGLVIACTAESAQALLSSTLNVNKGFSHHFLKPWLGNGLLSNPGDASWRAHRKMLTPTLHFRILEDYRRAMNSSASHFIEKLRQLGDQQVDIYPMIRMCTFGIIFETAFGISVDENDPDHLCFLSDCDELSDLIVARLMYLPQWVDTIFQFTPTGRRMRAASDRVTAYINKVIDSKLVSLHNNNDSGKSFIDTVIAMFREGLLTRKEVRDHAATFIVGGFDTTATAVAYSLHLLAHHPEIQEELLKEVESEMEDGEDVTKDQLKKLKLIGAVGKESMRLFPPLPLITRNIVTPVKVGNHVIPSGTVGIVDIFHLHRNPNLWEEPLEFRPSRFLDPTKRSEYSYVPFSAGPRNCIGQKFALQEYTILLAHIVKNFKLFTDQATDELQLSFDLILRPLNGISLRFEPRTHVSPIAKV